jgi:hypothetical protein
LAATFLSTTLKLECFALFCLVFVFVCFALSCLCPLSFALPCPEDKTISERTQQGVRTQEAVRTQQTVKSTASGKKHSKRWRTPLCLTISWHKHKHKQKQKQKHKQKHKHYRYKKKLSLMLLSFGHGKALK